MVRVLVNLLGLSLYVNVLWLGRQQMVRRGGTSADDRLDQRLSRRNGVGGVVFMYLRDLLRVLRLVLGVVLRRVR